METATLANGCFWCTETIFKRLKGVHKVTSGYTGGARKNPSYEQVSTGATGHAEAIQIEFDPSIIPFATLLDIFFHTHNPTTLNRQGNDIGTQYRSAIFYHDDEQKRIAQEKITELEIAQTFKDPIVTQIEPLEIFYPAEDYHKDYYEKNKDKPYCTFVINPKIAKLLEKYSEKVKEEYIPS
ncbi:MAG TPA: peptide-methionine (S)-S-oxide reductase MsrA [Candidatus Levybacteria bacterium]|nr:peptide-methionine (S)-S-oxide reductase MsrA [Candidatus Levybacteria bacterium]